MGTQNNQDQNNHIESQLKEILERLDHIVGAFPVVDGKADIEGHRQAHEAMIKAARAEEDFWREMKLDLAKKGAWGLILIFAGLIVVGVSVKLGLGAK